MLDLTTSVLLLTVTMLLQSIGWLLIWLTQRHVFQLTMMAGGFMVYAVTMVMLVSRDAMTPPSPAIIVLHNVLIIAANGMVTQGVASFLGQRGYPYLMAGCVVVAAIFWPAALIVAPDNVGLRVLVSNALTIVAVAGLIRIMAVDRSQPPILRWPAIGLFVIEIVALLARSVITIDLMRTPNPAYDVVIQAWYFFTFQIIVTAIFIILLIMVGNRLASDLRLRNMALQREVAERRNLQDQLSAALATEKALHEEQKQLLRMVTHEFRTPLAVVDRATEMIGVVLERPPETVSRRLSAIRDAVQRLVQLIDRFLDVERRDFNILQTERIDIAGLLDRVKQHFAGMEVESRLRFSPQPGLPFYLGDPEMLTTVLINLIDNALKYSPDGSPVEIAARTEGNAIVIAVADHGIGIPPAELASIGRRFFRASNTTPATGTGLGLYNTRRLLEYHNGSLDLQAGPDGGTVAAIRLPLPGVMPDVRTEVA
ncbi:MAG: HAMP domain-containing histidine kinase [Ferrovibrio sp.]|uniref:sensor histidine kinase n=1 Tax=Ferrovibrio sp. TaxID=1917215 RepID=UPI002625D3A0|nr:HAMP domain-containing sensor histidine kinase [Ferrovibrio sp.]MCW0235208.1 HAMP domain-containing histidine kinase [Ferrovibrio sp.]